MRPSGTGGRPQRRSRVQVWWQGLIRAIKARRTAARLTQEVVVPGHVRHDLDGLLIVSLTSYPPRFSTLALTVKSLIAQSTRPDKLILWLAHGDADQLPAEVIALTAAGLEIRECDNLRSYKKVIPALEAFPDAFIVTADDDQYYPPEWLGELVNAQHSSAGTIVCHRARVIQFDAGGAMMPYRSWYGATSPLEGPLLPIGYGGVLYPPGSLSPSVTDRSQFTALCPEADDLWLKWMSAAQGTGITLVTNSGPPFGWPGSQSVGLDRRNIRGGGNDRQAKALAETFGTAHVVTS